jgi:undecaprenyl-diphosphatase
VDWDHEVSLWFSARRTPSLSEAMLFIANAHETTRLLAATALLMLWRGLRRDWWSVQALVVVPAGMAINYGLKTLVQRARPAWDDPLVQLASYSFPSGHAAASTVFYGALCLLVFAHARSRLWRGLAAGVAASMVLVVCFSRLVLGAHYPADVVAGVAVGTLCLLACLRLLRR